MPETAAEPRSAAPGATGPGRPWALWLFLVLVGAAVLAGLRQKYPSPDFAGTVLLLADGDLDHAERRRQLERLFAQAAALEGAEAKWVGLLAAVALQNADRVAEAVAALGGLPPKQAPAPADRELLHLGDPMLGNLADALMAEIDGDRERARTRWRQVGVQSQMVRNAVAGELATAAAQRLR